MAIDCAGIRQDFPQLKDNNLVYLDNAASTLKPYQVIEAMSQFTSTKYSNVHRGVHKLSIEASKEYEDAHEVVAKFINARDWREVVFVRNTTEAINLVALSLVASKFIREGDEIIVSEAEHHSNLLPWVTVAKLARAKIKMIPVNEDGVPYWGKITEYLTERTKVVAIGHVSNVTGYRSPVKEVAKAAHQVGAIVVVDGAQSVPHMPVNVMDLGIDFLAFSGHKMLGPTGIGVLWGRIDLLEELWPGVSGGGTIKDVWTEGGEIKIEWDEPPWKFEAGTPPIIEAIGLRAAVEYLKSIGMDNVEEHERVLTEIALRRLEEEGVTILGPKDPKVRAGIVTFNIPGVHPDHVGLKLSSMGIAVRTGRHCAHILHSRLGFPQGSVRASFYIYNCPEDVERLVEAVRKAGSLRSSPPSSPH